MLKTENIGKSGPVTPLSPAAEPLFTSAHAALKFALNFTHGTLKRPALGQLQGGGGNGRGLAGLDGAAQAGMIRAELESLERQRCQVLVAWFTTQSVPCSCRMACCRGFRENAEWAEAVDWLTEFALVERLTGTVSHHRLRRVLVMRVFGVRNPSLSEIATACGVHRDTASDYNKRVDERLKKEQRIGMAEIETRFKERGIVPS